MYARWRQQLGPSPPSVSRGVTLLTVVSQPARQACQTTWLLSKQRPRAGPSKKARQYIKWQPEEEEAFFTALRRLPRGLEWKDGAGIVSQAVPGKDVGQVPLHAPWGSQN